jgi:hypothetical protein
VAISSGRDVSGGCCVINVAILQNLMSLASLVLFGWSGIINLHLLTRAGQLFFSMQQIFTP